MKILLTKILYNILKFIFEEDMPHKHIYVKALSDNGTPIEICKICGGQDGEKFWAKMNELYYEKFPEERPLTQPKKAIN